MPKKEQKTGKAQLSIWIDEELHSRAKARAMVDGVNMVQMVELALERLLARPRVVRVRD